MTTLETETPVLTEFEAYALAYAVAYFLQDEPDKEAVQAFVTSVIPKLLAGPDWLTIQ